VTTRSADIRQVLPDRPLATADTAAAESGTAARAAVSNAMTCDVEDYFQVQAFAGHIARDSWDSFASRVERNTGRVLDLFARHGVHATFFTLGWVAERHKSVIRRIVAEGHELASHGMEHRPVYLQSPDEFRRDVRRTKAILEDIGGTAVTGYRAASFSITEKTFWAFDVLAEEGHLYSSSIYPVRHDLYGIPDAPRFAFRPGGGKLLEVPMSTVALFGRNLPGSGGGYFRLLPYAISRWGFRQVNTRDRQPAIFYFHPWEIDPDQPRQHRAPLKSRFRHYLNLHRTEERLGRLLRDFAWDRMDRIYLDGGKRQ
jgi:polysaccharide deacetylase family protein (PEP-CTERM system associated)